MATSARLVAELAEWPTKDRMASILSDTGLRIHIGRYSIRVEDCSHFVFQQYGGDLGDPCVDADAGSVGGMIRDAKLVSDALSRAKVTHRFEILDDGGERVGYFHFNWPDHQI